MRCPLFLHLSCLLNNNLYSQHGFAVQHAECGRLDKIHLNHHPLSATSIPMGSIGQLYQCMQCSVHLCRVRQDGEETPVPSRMDTAFPKSCLGILLCGAQGLLLYLLSCIQPGQATRINTIQVPEGKVSRLMLPMSISLYYGY